MVTTAIPLVRPMRPRDPHEPHRVATPLELFFDLVFVVAIASAAAELHHGLSDGHLDALVGFLVVFFAIWWAWVNYAWFASAYDCDDVLFRLLTFVIMAGSLLLAAGVPGLFDDGQSRTVVAGYAVMRLAMVALWLRAAAGHPERRRTALTYAGGIAAVQLLWIARLAVDGDGARLTTFAMLVVAELAVPFVAERRGGATPFHPHHIAERYGLLTIIVLGEVILASVQAVQGVLAGSSGAETSGGAGPSAALEAAGAPGPDLLLLVVGALLLVFSLWWLYFKRDHVDLVAQQRAMTWVFGYAHYFVFASVAAVGSALAASVDLVEGSASVGERTIALALAVPVAVYALVLAGLHAAADRSPRTMASAVALALAVLMAALLPVSPGWHVLLVGLCASGAVSQHVLTSRDDSAAEAAAR